MSPVEERARKVRIVPEVQLNSILSHNSLHSFIAPCVAKGSQARELFRYERRHVEALLEFSPANASLDRIDALTRTNNNVKTLRLQWCKASNVKRSHNVMTLHNDP